MTMKRVVLFALLVTSSSCEPESAPGAAGSPTAGVSVPAESGAGSDPGAFLPSVCLGEEYLALWRRVDPEKATSEVDETRRGSECAWGVEVRGGVPIVTATHSPRSASIVKGAAGTLEGVNHGEWGGALLWHQPGGSQKALLSDNVIAILPAFGHYVVLTSVGHGTEGHVVEVWDQGGSFEVARVVDVRHGPTGGLVARDGTVLIATGEGLFRLSSIFRLEQILETNWWWRGPGPMTLGAGDTVYVGMRGMVAEVRFNPKGAAVTWFFPP